jgi:hypothetical protein
LVIPDRQLGSIGMNRRGRPTLFRPEYPDLARRLCLLGGTNEELASFFEVSRSTIEKGKKYVLHRGEEKEIRHVVHYPLDVQACMFWLRNRRRRHWLERAQPPRATDVTAASFSSARYRRLIGSSREKLSAIFVSHFWGPVQTEARARLLTAVP